MRVGILGSGLMGGKLGTIFARAGHEVVFSYARRQEKLKELARNVRGNARAGTPRTELVVAHTSSGAEELAKMIPKARVVSAFTLCRAKCFSACTKPSARPADRVWCTAATTRAAKLWPLS